MTRRGVGLWRWTTLVAVWVVMGAAPRGVAAADVAASPGPAYALSWQLDLPILLISGGLAASYLVVDEVAPPFCAPVCDRARVNAFDRWAAGYYNTTWQTVGDVTTGVTLVALPLSLFVGESWRPALSDLVVVSEALLTSSAIQVIVSYAVARPRPRVYGETAPLDQRTNANAARSFFSGHVADGMAATFATAEALSRLRRPTLALVTLIVGVTGTALIGVARVGAGGHFPSDVIIGAAVGSGVGIAIPALHGVGMRVAPLAGSEAHGLTLTTTF
jgi:membrane-associated phospholipid phosphatase